VRTVRYLSGIPRKELPAGHVVVHNHVRPVAPQPWPSGLNGFRFWVAAPDGDDYEVEPCDCEWRPELGGHYRVVLSG
jgi:hypothetical protein